MKTDQTKVFFKYEQNENGTRKVDGKIEAIAIDLSTKQEIVRREVKPRHGDTPDKLVGRKYAFKKLMTHSLENNLIPKSEIGLLWKSFGSMCKQPIQKLAY